jgi:PAS domain S-box-containing protein
MPTQLEAAQLEKILSLLKNPDGLSVSQIALAIDTNRNTTARYLDVLAAEGKIEARTVGPTKLYVLSKHQPFVLQLDLFKKAMDEASCGITIADARQPDMPLIYANGEFLRITGYELREVLGRNCRFLQGKKTQQKALEQIRQAMRQQQSVTAVLTNYTKNGTAFQNRLHLAPIFHEGTLTHYVGIQTVA